jgi:metal transporter CNNM
MLSASSNSYLAQRPLLLGLAKALCLSFGHLSGVQAAPLGISSLFTKKEEEERKPPGDPSLWLYLSVAAALVLLGGAFAGLTIALMGQVSI